MDYEKYALEAIKNAAKEGNDLRNLRVILDYELDGLPAGTYTILLEYRQESFKTVWLHSTDVFSNTYNIDIETFGKYIANGSIELFSVSKDILTQETKNFSFAKYVNSSNIQITNLIFRHTSDETVFIIKSVEPDGIIYLRYSDDKVVKSTIRDLQKLIRQGLVEFTIKNK